MPTWKFAPTPRNVAADTFDLAFDLGVYIVDDLPVTVNTSSTITYAGPLSIVSPAAEFVFTLKGQNLAMVGDKVTGGTITQITLTIAGATYVNATGLNISGAEFGNLAVVDFDSTKLLELLFLQGNDNITGTVLADDLNGMAGSDTLFGGAGSDDLDGGAGRDRIFGGAGDDYVIGGDGDDTIFDAKGNDTYIGGAGVDKFVFNTSVYAAGFNDIDDFSRADVILLDNDAFRGIGGAGKLAASKFKNIDTGQLDANDRFFYSQTSGALFYDPDGSGWKNAVLFLSFENGTRITTADFHIIG